MVYRQPYGSTCVNVGCVPSKFLIHRAKVAHFVRTAARFHIEPSEPRLDLAGLVHEKNAMIARHRDEARQGAHAAERLTLIEGEAHFVSAREVAVGDRTLRAEAIFIATGMLLSIPRVKGIRARPSADCASTGPQSGAADPAPNVTVAFVGQTMSLLHA